MQRSRNGRSALTPAPSRADRGEDVSQRARRARQRALCVGALREGDDVAELGELLRTAGVAVVGELVQRRAHPHPNTYLGPGKVEVTEVFWLRCPHCAALEPFITSWLKNKPAYIEFVRVPVMWGPVHRADAHLYYTLVALNRSDLIDKAFDAIQNQHQVPVSQNENEMLKGQEAFAQANGISRRRGAR